MKLFWTPPEHRIECGKTWVVCYAWASQEDVDLIYNQALSPPLPVLMIARSGDRWYSIGICEHLDELSDWFDKHHPGNIRGSLDEVKQQLEKALEHLSYEDQA